MTEEVGARPIREVVAHIVEILVRVLAVGVPVLYVLGRAFREGYWTELGFTPALMSYTVQDYLYWGFASLLRGLMWLYKLLPFGPLGTLFFALLAIAALSALAALGQIYLLPKLRQPAQSSVRWLRRSTGNQRGFGALFARPLFLLSQWVSSSLFYFLLTILGVAGSVSLAVYAGKQSATRDRAYLTAVPIVGSLDARPVVRLRSKDEDKVRSLLLECGPQWCVMLRGRDFVAVRQEDVLQIDHCQDSTSPGSTAADCQVRIKPPF